MMGMTHLAVGMAASLGTSLLFAKPETLGDCLITLAGGAVGGVLADIDSLDHDYHKHSMEGLVSAFIITLVIIATDAYFRLGVCETVLMRDGTAVLIAGIAFVLLCTVGSRTKHRTFTHSLVAMLAFSGCMAVIYPRMGLAMLVGYATHLILDLTNMKGIQIFYPNKTALCFRLCYAGRTANTVLMVVGFAATFLLLFYLLNPYLAIYFTL